ncbi:MAG: hypothetical protein ACXVLT_09415, partial [Flavisolibacter sp.]
MKRTLAPIFGIVCLLFVSKAFSQDEIAVVQKEWGQNKKELVSMAMDLTATDSAKFWPLYANYEKERQKLGRERLLILTDYSDHFQSLTSPKADELMTKLFKNELAITNLQQRYYISIKNKLGAMKAAKFIQVESYINTSI